MKNLIVCLFIFLCLSCNEEKEDGIIHECVGVSFYYLDNQTDKSFLIEFVSILNNQIDTTKVITTKQRVLLGRDSNFGSIPTPTNSFSNFALYILVDGKKKTIYSQIPVQNSLWIKRKLNATDPDYGCQNVDYTLTITDDMLM